MTWVTHEVLRYDDLSASTQTAVRLTPVNHRGTTHGTPVLTSTDDSGTWLLDLAPNVMADGSPLVGAISEAWKVEEAQTANVGADSAIAHIRVPDGWAFTTDVGADTLTATGNMFAANDRVRVTGTTLPVPLSAGIDFYVLAVGNTFQLAYTPGDVAIDLIGDGTETGVVQKVFDLTDILVTQPALLSPVLSSLVIEQKDTATTALIVKSAGAGYTADLVEWRDPTGFVQISINSTGAEFHNQPLTLGSLVAAPLNFGKKYASGADPTAPTAGCRVYDRDDGAGKSQLCVRFADGSIVVLATSTGVSG